MSEIIERYDHANRNYIRYTLYTREEIRKEWVEYKLMHLTNMRVNSRYITCTVRCGDEALVLIALMMRRADKGPHNFYYDENNKKVLAYCPNSGTGDSDIVELYESIISMFLRDKNLKYMNEDPAGKALFNDRKKVEKIKIVKPCCPDFPIILYSGNIHSNTRTISMLGNMAPSIDI